MVYDNLIYGHHDFVKWGPFEEGDTRDQSRLEMVIDKYDPLAVIHFAAFAYVGESVLDPAKYYFNNVVGTLILLEAMRVKELNRIVFSSSCATYGYPQSIPILENHPQQPVNPYGQSKLMIERILADYDRAYGMKNIVLRYFNAAGADPDGDVGEDHEPETHLIPLVLDVAGGRSSYVSIFGDDYGTKDGSCVRDYIHVSDLADAHVLALEMLESNNESASYNLGTGTGYTVKEIIACIERVTGITIPQRTDCRREGDPAILISESHKAKSELRWNPRFSDIETIISNAWSWYQHRFMKRDDI